MAAVISKQSRRTLRFLALLWLATLLLFAGIYWLVTWANPTGAVASLGFGEWMLMVVAVCAGLWLFSAVFLWLAERWMQP
jgi:hypothetical protein